MRKFDDYLNEQLQDEEFRKEYQNMQPEIRICRNQHKQLRVNYRFRHSKILRYCRNDQLRTIRHPM